LLVFALLAAAVPASDYAGAGACRECHAQQFAAQSAGGHARALGRSQPGQPGEWAFGAGVQATTFVSRVDGERYLEHGESWYRALKGYARTPGHTRDGGVTYRVFDPSAAILRCFGCHSTGPVAVGAAGEIVPAETGVRCEVCHRPSAAHVRNPGQTKPRNPRHLTADALNELCGACHRMPAAAGETTDLRDPWNARHQPLMLAASACFRQSRGRLSCLTCHDPHAPLERRVAAYSEACTGCHAAPRHKSAVAGRACVECHMPAVQLPNLQFANHRIGVYAAGDALTPARR
jgi:hypothetical protein